MINFEPPLLIVAPLADDFALTQVPWCDAARTNISVNRAKFKNLEMAEVIVDAMPFRLSRLTAAEARRKLTAETSELSFCDLPSSAEFVIGVVPGDNLTSARHIPEVNRRLLLLGKWIGESLTATGAAWMPSRRLVNFSTFHHAVVQYLAGGPFPTLLRTSVSEVRNGHFVTTGLHYFTGQEVRLTTPESYDLAAVSKHLLRIIDNITTHGKIIRPARSEGLVQGETLTYTPSDNLAHVEVGIANDAFNSDRVKIQ
ncbi:hypothetical protein [Parasphingorhabdus sp. NYA22]